MRLYLVAGLSLANLLNAQPAKVREETVVRRGPEGEVVGRLTLGADTEVRSRVTTETGSWCRVAGPVAGSVPCKTLLISQPPPPVVTPPPAPPATRASRLNAKPAPPPPPADLGVIEHPTAGQIRRAFPGLGEARAVHSTTPQATLVQEYKFSENTDVSVALWVRPTGDNTPIAQAELATKFGQQHEGRVRPHILTDGRRLRWSNGNGSFLVTGTSPDKDFEWSMIYTTSESPDDVTSQVLTSAAAIDRILFGTR